MSKKLISTIVKLILIVLIIVVTIRLSGALSNYYLLIINNALIYFICALGLTLLLGMCGQMSFASVMFMGVAGFTAALLSKEYGVNTMLAGLVGISVSAILAFVLGLALLKLQGSYFAFATIGIAQIGSSLFTNWKWFCNGADGRMGIPKLVVFGNEIANKSQWMILLVIVAVLAALLIERIRRTSLGRAAASVRDNVIVAQTMGVNVFRTKLICFVIASVLSGLAGVLCVYMNSYAVESMFAYNLSVNYILMVMLGGVNSTVGTLIGSVLMTLMPEFLRSMERYLRLIYGVLIIILMAFMPMGIAGLFQTLYKRVKHAILAQREVSGNE